MSQAHTVSYTIRSFCPSRIDQPYVHIAVLIQFFTQQLCIFCWVQWQEYTAKAGRECSLRFCNTHFCTGYLGCIATDEVVHSLCLVQFGDRGQDTKSIAGQEEYI